MVWLTLILTLFLGILGTRWMLYKKLNKLKELGILHVKPWPFIGNYGSALFRRCPITDILKNIYKLDENAKYVGFYDFNEPVIMIRSIELIKSIAVKNFDHFTDHRAPADPELEPMFGKNIAGLRGEKWREMRNLLTPAFTSSKLKIMFKTMSNCGKNIVQRLADDSLEKKIKVIDSRDAFTRYTNDVIVNCSFGISIDSMTDRNNDFWLLGKAGTNFDGYQGVKFFFAKYYPKIAKFFNIKFSPTRAELFFERIVRETMATREREGITRPDIIQLMMETRMGKKSIESNNELTIQEMAAQAFIFFFSGFDSSRLACFVAHEIAVNPNVQSKLHDELDKVLVDTKIDDVTYEAINEMQYLDAVINETLRLYPLTILHDRLCVKTFELPPALPNGKAIIIEPGQSVAFPAFCIHRDSKYFPRPDKFEPKRFTISEKHDIDSSTHMPFGQGPRMCIGNRFTVLGTKVLIFHLLAKFRLKPSERMTLPLEFDKWKFAMMPVGGFWLELESRV